MNGRTISFATRSVMFAWLFLLLPCAETFAAGRVALVIGNGAYRNQPALVNPPRDAADISESFRRLGFSVTTLIDADVLTVRKALVEFGRAAAGSDMAIVFYAGHGIEIGGENWLIPVDAELRTDTDAEAEAVSLKSMTLQVAKARQLGLVILDACRNNPFAAKMQRSLRTRSVTRGLALIEPTENVLVAYAAKDGTVALDGDGRNSPFTTALLHNLETPGLEINFLFRIVRDDVLTSTRNEQQPFVYGSLSRQEIYLVPGQRAQPTPVEPQPSPAVAPGPAAGPLASRNSSGPQPVRRIAARGYNGPTYVEADFTRDSAGNWEETNRRDPSTHLHFAEKSSSNAEIVIFDDLRDLYLRFNLVEQRIYFRMGKAGAWNAFYKIVEDRNLAQSAR